MYAEKFTETGHTFYANEASSCFWKNSILLLYSIFDYKAKTRYVMAPEKRYPKKGEDALHFVMCIYNPDYILGSASEGRRLPNP